MKLILSRDFNPASCGHGVALKHDEEEEFGVVKSFIPSLLTRIKFFICLGHSFRLRSHNFITPGSPSGRYALVFGSL